MHLDAAQFAIPVQYHTSSSAEVESSCGTARYRAIENHTASVQVMVAISNPILALPLVKSLESISHLYLYFHDLLQSHSAASSASWPTVHIDSVPTRSWTFL